MLARVLEGDPRSKLRHAADGARRLRETCTIPFIPAHPDGVAGGCCPPVRSDIRLAAARAAARRL